MTNHESIALKAMTYKGSTRNMPKASVQVADNSTMIDDSIGSLPSGNKHLCLAPLTPGTQCSRSSLDTEKTTESTPASFNNNSDAYLLSALSESYATGADLMEENENASEAEDSKRKKKKKSKKSKEKKEKKRKSKGKKEKRKDTSEEGEMPLTVRDEKLVEELCSFLTNSLSSTRKKESFLRLLREENASVMSQSVCLQRDELSTVEEIAASPTAVYASLASPEPSITGSLLSHSSALSQINKKVAATHLKGQWTFLDPPSVAASEKGRQPSISRPRSANVSSSSQASVSGRSKEQSSSSSANLTDSSSSFSSKGQSSDGLTRSNHGTVESIESDADSTPEQLFLALPPAFRTYLLGLHAEEMEQQMPTNSQQVAFDSEHLLMSGPRVRGVPSQLDDSDVQSVISDLTGTTGMVSTIAKPAEKPPPIAFIRDPSRPPVAFIGGEEDDDDDSSDDSDDEEDNTSLTDIPDVGTVCSHYGPRPDRPALVTEKVEAKKKIKKVRFNKVITTEFNTVLDCNPSCSDGPPIALGWFKVSESVNHIDNFPKRHCRFNEELMLSRHTREGILLKMGYTATDVNDMVRRVNRIKIQRKRTAQSVRVQNIEYAMESVGRRFKSLVRGGSKRKVSEGKNQ